MSYTIPITQTQTVLYPHLSNEFLLSFLDALSLQLDALQSHLLLVLGIQWVSHAHHARLRALLLRHGADGAQSLRRRSLDLLLLLLTLLLLDLLVLETLMMVLMR